MPDEMPATDDSVTSVLETFADDGWTENHVARPGGTMKCGRCGTETGSSELRVDAMHRVEGASDPEDMQMVLGIVCPNCEAHGALVASYGAAASEQDSEFVVDLDLDDSTDPVAG